MGYSWRWASVVPLSVLIWGTPAQFIGLRTAIGSTPGEYGKVWGRLESLAKSGNRLSQIDLESEAERLNEQGTEFYNTSQYREAIGAFESALEIYQQIGSRREEARVLGNLGSVYSSIGEYQQATDLHEQSLTIKREIDDQEGEATSLGTLGNVAYLRGQYRQAIDFFEQSLEISRKINSRSGEAAALGNLGLAYTRLSEYESAYDYYDQSYAIVRELGNPRKEASLLTNLGFASNNIGDYRQAISFHQQALVIMRELGDRAGEATALLNTGVSQSALGNYEEAVDLQNQVLAIRREIGDRSGEARALYQLGTLSYSVGDYPQAIEYQNRALEISLEIGERRGEALVLSELGTIYVELGDYDKAINFHQQALVIEREMGDRQAESHSIGELGIVYSRLGDYTKALEHYGESLEIATSIGDRKAEADLLMSMGSIHSSLEEYEQAIKLKEQALSISRELEDRQGEANTLGSLGDVYSSLSNYQKAIDYYDQSIEITRELGDRDRIALGLGQIGRVYLKQRNDTAAEVFLSEAASILDELRSPRLSDGDRINFFEVQSSTYKNLEVALTRQGKKEKALEASERGRARSFVQVLSENLLPIDEREGPAQAPSFSDIKRIAGEQQSVLVEYSLITELDDSQWLYIWVIQPNGTIDFKQVKLNESLGGISDLVSRSRKAIGVRGRGGFEPINDVASPDLPEVLRKLHQVLVEPIADFLPDDPEQRIVFIPQDELFLVPFPALIDESGKYLIANHTMLTAPSIQILDLTHQQAIARNTGSDNISDVLAIGNPTMPEVWEPQAGNFVQLSSLEGAEDEALDIASLFGIDALIRSQATEHAVKRRIESARIVHFATHGLLEYGTPEDLGVRNVPGAIALAPTEEEDGLLTSAEILEFNLQAELVVLSACDTGLGDITGDGVIGLSRSLISAGTPSVVVSLWSIPDTPTAALMTKFYSQMRQGKDKDQALRQAMLSTMIEHPEPENWAAFTLIGDVGGRKVNQSE